MFPLIKPKQEQFSYTFSGTKQSEMKIKVKKKKNDRIAGDEARNAIGDFEGVARASPDDLHLTHIEPSFAPLAR
jgi:hypothetical protein